MTLITEFFFTHLYTVWFIEADLLKFCRAEIAKATGASHATVKNIREQLELAVKILQFNELDRVQVICPENWMALILIETGTLGVVQRTDMKKGVCFNDSNSKGARDARNCAFAGVWFEAL